jgi:hypothetical protein
MATISRSPGARLSGRIPADRPRTHPKPPELAAGSPLLAVLSDVRLRLEVAHAAAAVCARALRDQSADSDLEISVVLQRAVADEIDRQIDRLNAAIEGARYGQ